MALRLSGLLQKVFYLWPDDVAFIRPTKRLPIQVGCGVYAAIRQKTRRLPGFVLQHNQKYLRRYSVRHSIAIAWPYGMEVSGIWR